ncbi:MAG TPA: hypothetical protein PLB68_09915, partial [Candidatus Aminicenantes bacterium]|nr:hypothetical protein [Candidatus Aminicenantes bacterium]
KTTSRRISTRCNCSTRSSTSNLHPPFFLRFFPIYAPLSGFISGLATGLRLSKEWAGKIVVALAFSFPLGYGFS